ncbi:RagB/SusD family nutrient uptake outer membrane protein [Spirosoma taeanense]|uniref:RagB/SusD family nutrient uptake outer membrane protein n=1 Tax=Spirosoma taeanense TaxID=2735870 RepID=A0A6M5Y778_9BACT|nr:RagB/SusD family nutrient uptake outer membrane protein [Spirosoma taeanense]QJW88933.1 RagB/SusD family nutrient uptake outer membrane protein [Spirosoma taeanense]
MNYTQRISGRLLLAAFLVGGVTACKEFLDTPPQGQIGEAAVRNDPAAAQNLVTGVYNTMWEGGMHGFDYVGMTNIASDDADKGSSPADGANSFGTLDNLTVTPSVGNLNNVWATYFRAIARANQALALIPLSPAEQTVRNQLEGEVRFLRAYFYFNLVRFFGGVPLINGVPPVEDINNTALQARASREEVYNLIISDLRFAASSLPIKGQTQTGRATKAAAMGMLAKVYLYQKNWQQAYSLSDSIIKNQVGTYDLLPNYANIWREVGANSVESLFEVQTGINLACNAAIELYVVCQGPRAGGKRGWSDLGFGFGTPSQSLLDEYEAGDRRREATIIFINPAPRGTILWDGYRVPSRDSVENDRYNYKAYHSRTAERNCGNNDRLPKNLRILRLGEILLIHAEAAQALGRSSEALADVNRLRSRAGLPAHATIDLAKIWHERRLELAMEHDRFFDLIRQESVQSGRAVQAFAAHGKTFVKGKNEVFPIPQTQIQLSGGALTQNPGY